LNPGKQEAARAEGLENIAALLRQCSIREALYSRTYDGSMERKQAYLSVHVNYRDELKDLYVRILTFQATCLCYLTRHTASRVVRDMIVWDDWDDLSAQVDSQTVRVKSIEEQWRDFKLQEQWEIEAENNKKRMAIDAAIRDEVTRVRRCIAKTQEDQTRLELFRWLSPEDYSKRYNNIRERHERDTGAWLLEHKIYKDWKESSGSFLWLHGKGTYINLRQADGLPLMNDSAGSGKSYLRYQFDLPCLNKTK
jgi:hypothetical protein